MATEAMKRLIARIEQTSGLDLSQREAELGEWLRTRGKDVTDSVPESMTEAALESFSEALPQPNSIELGELFRRFTVSYTRFFRDAEQLYAVASALAALGRSKLHIWIAGCSTGEEAYTLALLSKGWSCAVEITASDVNTRSLAQARAGSYAVESLQSVPPQYHDDFVRRGAFIEVSQRLRRSISFVEHSLTEAPLMPQDAALWDLILCRNVLIYFRSDNAIKTLDRLASVIAQDGYIVLGTSEFHFRTKQLVPTRIGERICLRRTTAPQEEPVPQVRSALPPPTAQPIELEGAVERADAPPSSRVAPLVTQLLSGQLDGVLSSTLPLLMRDPEHQPALLLAGIAYHMKGRHHEAAALLERTLHQHPSCWPATYFLAVSLEALERPNEALELYAALQSSEAPTAAAQSLIDLLALQPWKSETIALARRRLSGSFDRLPLRPQRDFGGEPEKGQSHAFFHTPQGPHRGR